MTEARFFYVSAINGPRKHLVAWPYDTHDRALSRVDPVRDIAYEREPFSWFFAWGTAGSEQEFRTPLGAA